MTSILSECEAQHEIALVLVGVKQVGDRIAEILRAPARIAEFRRHPQPAGLEFYARAECRADVEVFMELRNRTHIHVNRGCRVSDLVHSRDVSKIRAEIDERTHWTGENGPL